MFSEALPSRCMDGIEIDFFVWRCRDGEHISILASYTVLGIDMYAPNRFHCVPMLSSHSVSNTPSLSFLKESYVRAESPCRWPVQENVRGRQCWASVRCFRLSIFVDNVIMVYIIPPILGMIPQIPSHLISSRPIRIRATLPLLCCHNSHPHPHFPPSAIPCPGGTTVLKHHPHPHHLHPARPTAKNVPATTSSLQTDANGTSARIIRPTHGANKDNPAPRGRSRSRTHQFCR